MIKVDIEKAATEIVEVLHANKIPLAFTDVVFERSKEIIDTLTIPESPNERRCKNGI